MCLVSIIMYSLTWWISRILYRTTKIFCCESIVDLTINISHWWNMLYIMIALEFTFNTFSNGWKRKKKLKNMLILFYTLTWYFHREKCFEFEGNVYDLFFIIRDYLGNGLKKISHLYLDSVFLIFLQWFFLKQFCKVCNNA